MKFNIIKSFIKGFGKPMNVLSIIKKKKQDISDCEITGKDEDDPAQWFGYAVFIILLLAVIFDFITIDTAKRLFQLGLSLLA